MLFNSFPFLLGFLPVVLIVFFLIGRHSERLSAAWLAAASLFFYGWWDARYLWLLVGSIVFNYALGYKLATTSDLRSLQRRALLVAGVSINLAVLGYFKYASFFVNTINAVGGVRIEFAEVLLPLGISFFTFTQIAFLVDAARGEAREFSFVHYGLFVTYFPHLIAGPVLHHREMMPQFREARTYRFSVECLTVGATIFALGLFKKVVMADGIAPYASSVFASAEAGSPVPFLQSWGGALAYTLQLYFDFSGYCDMAIGLSFMLGVRLPLNFNSPYKATNITDFWRRWHMTLSRFLRDYLYIPLGGNRRGKARRYVNLFATMLLGGLWHGAGWTFVVWGALHGLYLVIHQACQGLLAGLGPMRYGRLWKGVSIATTFTAVVVAWVFFRASSFEAAITLLKGMAGMNGVTLPSAIASRLGAAAEPLVAMGVVLSPGGGRDFVMTYLWIAALLPIVFLAPNTQQIMHRYAPALGQTVAPRWPFALWRPTAVWGIALAVVFACGLLSLTRPSEFLYFQF